MAIGLELPIAFLLLQPLNSGLKLGVADLLVSAICELLSGLCVGLCLLLSGNSGIVSLLSLLNLSCPSSSSLDGCLGGVGGESPALLDSLDGGLPTSASLLADDAPFLALYTVVDEVFYLCFPSV